MPGLGWLDVSEIDFNALLLLEPLHAACLAGRQPSEAMGTALAAHPAVRWYLGHIHPPIQAYIDGCLALAQPDPRLKRCGRLRWPCWIRCTTG
jgi:hypothetical protein